MIYTTKFRFDSCKPEEPSVERNYNTLQEFIDSVANTSYVVVFKSLNAAVLAKFSSADRLVITTKRIT